MAIIPQIRLFGWEKIEQLGDLERLRLVLEYMPDEKLMQKLEKERGLGRNDYPVRGVWNTVLAGIVYQHISIESLRRQGLKNVTEALENVIKGVESALAQAMQKKEQAEEELNRSTKRLHQQELAVKSIIRQLEAIIHG